MGEVRRDLEHRDALGESLNVDKLLKAKYRQLSLQHHPDRTGGNIQRFQELAWAFNLLKCYNDRQNFSNHNPVRAIKAVSSALTLYLSTKDALVLYNSVQEDTPSELSVAKQLVSFIKAHGGQINVGLEYPLFPHRDLIKEKMGRLATFITNHQQLGLGFCSTLEDEKGALLYVRTSMYKTVVCRDIGKSFAGARCAKGLDCGFLHPVVEFVLDKAPVAASASAPSATVTPIDVKPSDPPSAAARSEETAPKICPHFKRGHCKYGSKCKKSHSTGDAPLRPTKTKGFDWSQLKGRKKVIVIGGTGQGKSTFINSIHNYFRATTVETMEAVIETRFLQPIASAPRSTEMNVRDTTTSKTEMCTEYAFRDPRNTRNEFIIVDTPGLGDTRGTRQDEENLKMILKIAAEAEAAGELSGFIFVCKGTENKRTLSVDTVMTIIRGSLPDEVMGSMIAVITNCANDFAMQCEKLLPPDIDRANMFVYDNPAFLVDMATLDAARKRSASVLWGETMDRVGSILSRAARLQHRGGCVSMMQQRHRVLRIFHEIRTKFTTLQQTLDQINAAELELGRAKSAQAQNANFKVTKTVTKKVFYPDPSGRHHTTCSSCTFICHQCCGLSEISTKGSNAFTGCAAFCGSQTCNKCPEHCSYEVHYHGRDLVRDETSTVDDIVKELEEKYVAATQKAGEVAKKVKTASDMKAVIARAMEEIVKEMRQVCAGIKKLCSGFNMVHELNLLIKQLEAEQRLMNNLEASRRADTLIQSVRSIANEFSARR